LLRSEDAERLGRAVQGIVLAGRFAQAVVEFEDFGDDGIDLVLGAVADIAGRIDQATIDSVAGPTIAIVPGIRSRRPIVVVTGRSDAELDTAIAKLGVVAPVGSAPGLNALEGANGHQINAAGQSLSFSDLGIEKQELVGHTLRIDRDAGLPADFLPADYGRVSIDLAGGYAAGLGPDAQIIVEINGNSAGSVRLSSAHGESFGHKRHFLPLSGFRPGLNRIELRVNAPDVPGVGCDTSADVPSQTRVWLNGTSKIVFPALARIGRLPDLAMAASGAFPFADPAARMTLVVPTPDRATLGVALTVMARLGLAAGRQIPFSFVTNQPAGKSGHVLIVAPARALDPASMRQAQLDPDLIRQAWSTAAELQPAADSRAALRRRAYEGDWPDGGGTPARRRRARIGSPGRHAGSTLEGRAGGGAGAA
jgi:hypothetical protein